MRKRAWTVEMRSCPRADGLERLALAMRLVLVPSSAPSVDNGSREPTDADVAHEGDDARGEAMQ